MPNTQLTPDGVVTWTYDGIDTGWTFGGSDIEWRGSGEVLVIEIYTPGVSPAFGAASDFVILGVWDSDSIEGVF